MRTLERLNETHGCVGFNCPWGQERGIRCDGVQEIERLGGEVWGDGDYFEVRIPKGLSPLQIAHVAAIYDNVTYDTDGDDIREDDTHVIIHFWKD